MKPCLRFKTKHILSVSISYWIDKSINLYIWFEYSKDNNWFGWNIKILANFDILAKALTNLQLSKFQNKHASINRALSGAHPLLYKIFVFSKLSLNSSGGINFQSQFCEQQLIKGQGCGFYQRNWIQRMSLRVVKVKGK